MYTLFVNTRSHLHSLRIYSLTFTLVGKYKFTFTHIYFSPTRCVRDDYMRRCTCTCAYFLLVCKFRVSVTTCEGGYMCKCVFRVYVQISCLYVTTCVGKYMCRWLVHVFLRYYMWQWVHVSCTHLKPTHLHIEPQIHETCTQINFYTHTHIETISWGDEVPLPNTPLHGSIVNIERMRVHSTSPLLYSWTQPLLRVHAWRTGNRVRFGHYRTGGWMA